MTSAEERMKILKMIQDGKISADEGAKLLSALSTSSQKRSTRNVRKGNSRWMRVRVTDTGTGKSKVNVNLPMSLVDAGLNIAAQFAPDVEVANLTTAIQEAVEENLLGKIVDVYDEEDGEHIEIFID